jgi:cell division protein FtsN
MASRRRRRNTRRQPAPPWVWAVAGLAAGLLVAFLVFLQMRSPTPESTAADSRQPLSVPAERTVAPEPERAPEPARAAVKPAPKPRFDFYNLLPEMEVIVPEEEIRGDPSQAGVKQVEQPGTYLLQAGSFRGREQADQLRARLGLLGLETSVQTVSVDASQTWHRVRVGPFSNLQDLNEARALLVRNGVEPILIRLKN